MARQQSIVRYELIYLASIAVGLMAYPVNWSAMVNMLAQNPALAGKTWLLWARVVIGLAISLTLLYFTARAPRIVAKWIVAIFASFVVLGLLFSFVQFGRGHANFDFSFLLTVIVNILYILAAALLFRPDAAAWFGEMPMGEESLS